MSNLFDMFIILPLHQRISEAINKVFVFRELNELRKPALADPEILRFFRYMKAAKDGQDGQACQAYEGCPSLTAHEPSPAMLTTFNDINKLVLARKLE